jgi:hypothetical protein
MIADLYPDLRYDAHAAVHLEVARLIQQLLPGPSLPPSMWGNHYTTSRTCPLASDPPGRRHCNGDHVITVTVQPSRPGPNLLLPCKGDGIPRRSVVRLVH